MFRRQFRGYNREEVDSKIYLLEKQIEQLKTEVESSKSSLDKVQDELIHSNEKIIMMTDENHRLDKRNGLLEDQIKRDDAEKLKRENSYLKEEISALNRKLTLQQRTNDEISRLALKEASDLIEKAKKNANMILKEAMDYVRDLTKDVSTLKDEATMFRENVVKLSEEMLETIDKSEIFSLIKEENTEKETDQEVNL